MVEISFDADTNNQGSEISFHRVPKEEMEKFSRLLGVPIEPLDNFPKGTKILTFKICGVEVTLFSKRE